MTTQKRGRGGDNGRRARARRNGRGGYRSGVRAIDITMPPGSTITARVLVVHDPAVSDAPWRVGFALNEPMAGHRVAPSPDGDAGAATEAEAIHLGHRIIAWCLDWLGRKYKDHDIMAAERAVLGALGRLTSSAAAEVRLCNPIAQLREAVELVRAWTAENVQSDDIGDVLSALREAAGQLEDIADAIGMSQHDDEEATK